MAGTVDVQIGALSSDGPEKQVESIVQQVNENFRLIANEDRTKIIRDDSGEERLLIGYHQDGFADGNVGIKLSQSGVNVLSATDKDLIFSSSFNSFKIVESGTAEVTAPGVLGTSANVRVTHQVGYNPLVVAYGAYSPTGTAFPLPLYSVVLTGADAGKIGIEVNYEAVGGDTITFFVRNIVLTSTPTIYIRSIS